MSRLYFNKTALADLAKIEQVKLVAKSGPHPSTANPRKENKGMGRLGGSRTLRDLGDLRTDGIKIQPSNLYGIVTVDRETENNTGCISTHLQGRNEVAHSGIRQLLADKEYNIYLDKAAT